MDSIEQKKVQRFQFLSLVYDRTDGDSDILITMQEIGEALGWSGAILDRTFRYLADEWLIKLETRTSMSITHEGVLQIEQARSQSEEPTQYFPAIINIMSGDFSGSSINVGSTLNDVTQATSDDTKHTGNAI
jgi:hypothetical protein